MVGLKDVARDTGLSIRTVSRVMTGKGAVSERALAKVMESATRLGYRPNRAARSLKLNQSYEVTVILSGIDELFMEKVYFMEKALRESGYWVSLLMAESGAESSNDIPAIIEEALDRRPAAIVIRGGIEREIAKIEDSGIPYLLIDSMYSYDSVNINRSQGVYDAVKYLHSTGRRKIAYAGMGEPENQANMSRLPGYIKAINELRLFPEMLSGNTVLSAEQFENGRYVAHQIDLERSPDAIIAYSDFMAMGLLAGFYDRKIRVPDQIAVVGFDDRPAASRSAPPLTTVRQPNKEVGLKAAEIILKKIAGEAAPEGGWTCALPTTLVVRETS